MDNKELLHLMAEQLKLSKQLKARIRELEAERTAPLAIVSTALRLPGGLNTPQDYWEFLLGDRDVVREIPEDRPGLRSVFDPKPNTPNRSYVDRAGFLSDVAEFDPAFFGMSQREAESTDPQQRLLMETAWEAMERAGIAVRRRDRINAGVFIGIMTSEYGERLTNRTGDREVDPYYGTGGGLSMAAGRVSYVMGFSGPAVSVDTACSSSLVALHLGAQALRRGECRYALVGGANLIFSPDLMVSLCQNQALAPDGRSKTFTAAADGYGRGEGVGVAVLMRLDDAEREGRPILAVLRGSAVMHDGASSGLTVPNGIAQQEVIRAALADAGVAAHEVGVVETHGTGTSLGDPIEVGALDAVIGAGAPNRTVPALLSTLKSRLGHLEGAAGIAALIKIVLMLQHGVVPVAVAPDAGPLNEYIPWDRVRLTVPRTQTPWPSGYERRIAGVSAFGMSGTNAHAILEAYTPAPQPEAPAAASAMAHLVTLSAKNATSLTELVTATASYLVGTPQEQLAAAAHTLRAGRAPFEHRVAVVGTSGGELAEKLAVAVGHAGKVTAKNAQTSVTLRVGSGVVRLSAGIKALIAAYPQLGAVIGGEDQAPAERIKRLLQSLGLRVKAEQRTPTSGAAAAEVAWGEQVFPLITEEAAASPANLLNALAALFVDGADLRLEALRPAGARILGDLPTYAFRRKRCWIDEPALRTVPTQRAGASDEAPVPGNARVPDKAPAPEQSADTAQTAQAALDQELIHEFLISELMSIMHAEEALDHTETFLEVGGDSFTAMQLTMSIEERYQVEIPLDDFNEDLQISVLIDRLTRRIVEARVPADKANGA
ncbi:MAG TPA: beta-ketoacyl synthase N-terminal-like domain-containing protein [Actinocrinis sp.]|uniref:beta-ketoacyl synthase N-terminal-like domain-containing protein n=1 Tax=Actinocrinis sp. TaxID=1920516 RepID=UPI002D696AE5|nr:beta-ketoacyl synthase N-terminal-like domain-containing protein [Actinocrinis sp.]HZU55354.1 beta-ketoacyl synthase N-terminal-like domain-containing protein [Actinocrinis sp.]